MQGPCEQVCKVFLMEEDLGEEVTYDVMEHIPAFVAHHVFYIVPHNNVCLFLATRVTDLKSTVDTGCKKLCAFGYVTQQKRDDKTFSDDKCGTVRHSE